MIKQKVVVIIPAYNEEKTIVHVIDVVRSCPLVDQVIVVSDGSKDHTAEVARHAGATTFPLETNRGKGGAMLYGVKQTDATVLVFLDADLIGLTKEHVEQLVLPVLSGTDMMHVGVIDRGRCVTRLMHVLPLISGQRAMKRSVIESIPPTFLQGFMVEPALNFACRSKKWRIGISDLAGLDIRRKFQKVRPDKAVIQYLSMSTQILWSMAVVRAAHLLNRF